MSKFTKYLPDVNVWLALAYEHHEHHGTAAGWLRSVIRAGHELGFCRITQMGFLRLLTNQTVMGPDVFSSQQAWQFFESIGRRLPAVVWEEPDGLEAQWKNLSSCNQPLGGYWSDSYLEAFCRIQNLTVVSLDKGFSTRKKSSAIWLLAEANR